MCEAEEGNRWLRVDLESAGYQVTRRVSDWHAWNASVRGSLVSRGPAQSAVPAAKVPSPGLGVGAVVLEHRTMPGAPGPLLGGPAHVTSIQGASLGPGF